MMMIILGEGVKKLFFFLPLYAPLAFFFMVRDACPCREDYDESWGKRRM